MDHPSSDKDLEASVRRHPARLRNLASAEPAARTDAGEDRMATDGVSVAGRYREGRFQTLGSAEATGLANAYPVDPAAPSRGRYGPAPTLSPAEQQFIAEVRTALDQGFGLLLPSAERVAIVPPGADLRIVPMGLLTAAASRVQARLLDQGLGVDRITPREAVTTALVGLGFTAEPVADRALETVQLRPTGRYADPAGR